MGKYTSEPMVEGFKHLKAKLASRYLESEDDPNPRDFLREEIAKLSGSDLTHYYGVLVCQSVDVSLRGSWAGLNPTQAAVRFLAAYIWPYFCDDRRVEQKMRASKHSGCLPVARPA